MCDCRLDRAVGHPGGHHRVGLRQLHLRDRGAQVLKNIAGLGYRRDNLGIASDFVIGGINSDTQPAGARVEPGLIIRNQRR